VTGSDIVGLLIAVALLGYLVSALVWPDRL
jgi:K+-transporting ATPase KdpF subunit